MTDQAAPPASMPVSGGAKSVCIAGLTAKREYDVLHRSFFWPCPMAGCDRRFGPADLLLGHLSEPKFGGHGLTLTNLAVHVDYEPKRQRRKRLMPRRRSAE